MTSVWILILMFISIAASAQIKLIKLRNPEQITAEYCRVATGGDIRYCGKPSNVEKLDVLYVPDKIGKQIEAHIQQAFAKKYYINLDKQDLFHGHFMAKGPQTVYPTPASYFADLQVVLYHSQEYTETWDSIPLELSPFTAHENQRSFVGSLKTSNAEVTAAIDLIQKDLFAEPYPESFLRGYKRAGTVYTEELNESQNYSLHKYTNFGGQEDILIKTCRPTETECQPCKILTMAHIFSVKNGRYKSPDGKKYDVVFHCEYFTDSTH